MNRRAYYKLCATMPADWLAQCVADPSPYMTPGAIRVARLALRKKGVAA